MILIYVLEVGVHTDNQCNMYKHGSNTLTVKYRGILL